MTEIARLKAQLVTVKNKKLKTAPCVKCGYFSDVSIAQNLQALKKSFTSQGSDIILLIHVH